MAKKNTEVSFEDMLNDIENEVNTPAPKPVPAPEPKDEQPPVSKKAKPTNKENRGEEIKETELDLKLLKQIDKYSIKDNYTTLNITETHKSYLDEVVKLTGKNGKDIIGLALILLIKQYKGDLNELKNQQEEKKKSIFEL